MSKPAPSGRAVPSRSVGGACVGCTGVDRWAVAQEVEVGIGVDEVIVGRGDEGVQVVAERLPGRERDDGAARVGAEAVHDTVVVGDETGAAGGIDRDGAAEVVERVEDVVENRVAGRAAADVHRPAAVGLRDERVVDDDVVLRAGGAVDLVETDAARVIVVEEIVADHAVGHAVHVDSRPAAGAVAVDDVVLDQRIRDQAVAALALVAVHVDAVGVVVVHEVVADDRAVAAVRDVDAVLGNRVVGLVVLDREVVGEAGEDAPAAVVAGRAVAHGDEVRRGRRGCPRGCDCRREAVDDDVVGAFDVDAVGGDVVVRRDRHAGAVGKEGDRATGGPGRSR